MSDRRFYILSLKWTRRGEPYITFWRPENAGYIWAVRSAGEDTAGVYTEEQVRGHLAYYNNGESTLAVPVEAVEVLLRPIPAGVQDYGDAVGVPFTLANLNSLKKAAPLPVAERHPSTGTP